MTTTFAFVYAGPSVKDLLDDYGVNVTGWTGGGMPPLTNISLPYALGDGSYYQRTIYGERVIVLACTVNQKTLAGFHTKRKAIIAAITRDALNSGTFILRYYGAGATSVDIPVRYNGGLEMDLAADDPLKPFTISLLAVNPFWQGSSLNTVNMAESGTLTDATWLVQSTAGVWAGANAAPNNVAEAPTCIVNTAAGITYIGTAAALYVRAANGTFTKYATTGGGILCLSLGIDGTTVYIGGSFTNIGGLGVGKLVKLAGTTFTNPSSGTIASSVYGIAATSSILWASVDDSTNGRGLYRCSYGGAWETNLTSFAAKSGRAMANYNNYQMVIIAATPNAGGEQHLYQASPDYFDFYDLGVVSAGGSISAIVYDGYNAYIGGAFTTFAGYTNNNVANASAAMSALAGGLNNAVSSIFLDGSTLYAAGAFTNTGYAYFAKYESGTWALGGITTKQANTAIAYNAASTVISLGFAAPGTAADGGAVAGTTSIDNTSDRTGYPTITITAAAAVTLYSIVNTYTGDSLLFNYVMGVGEVITINTTPGVWTVTSSSAGNILGALLAGSSLSSFGVSPGTHNYTMQFSDGTKATAVLTYYYQYMSADSVA